MRRDREREKPILRATFAHGERLRGNQPEMSARLRSSRLSPIFIFFCMRTGFLTCREVFMGTRVQDIVLG